MLNRLKKFISEQLVYPKIKLRYNDDLQGTVAIVTGASKGIGRAVVEMLLSQGASVVAVSRTPVELTEFVGKDEKKLLAISADLRLPGDVQMIIAKTLEAFGKIDVLINNAGLSITEPLDELSMEAFESIVSTNLTAAFLLSREVLPHMKTRGSGQIINIGSKISHNTNVRPNKVMYATTKSALEAFSFALNKELKQWGIRVSCLMPGTVHTFVSKDVQSQLSPYQVAEVVLMTIKLSDVDFEGIIFKSVNQDI